MSFFNTTRAIQQARASLVENQPSTFFQRKKALRHAMALRSLDAAEAEVALRWGQFTTLDWKVETLQEAALTIPIEEMQSIASGLLVLGSPSSDIVHHVTHSAARMISRIHEALMSWIAASDAKERVQSTYWLGPDPMEDMSSYMPSPVSDPVVGDSFWANNVQHERRS